MYYSATILRMAGFPSKSSAILFSSFIALANCFGSLTAMRLIDRSGRRRLLLSTLVPVGLSLIILSATFASLSMGTGSGGADGVGFISWLALASLVLYVYCYAIGLGECHSAFRQPNLHRNSSLMVLFVILIYRMRAMAHYLRNLPARNPRQRRWHRHCSQLGRSSPRSWRSVQIPSITSPCRSSQTS